MMAIGNGLASHGGCVPYTSTFLNFIEYGFPSVRLAALSHHHQIFVMTHDSIGLGEDGPVNTTACHPRVTHTKPWRQEWAAA